ncbi:unnamed protein product [Ranitomeya imitator]|uniref:Uncharacterized protein n=1 Tax=Ranitomeya imitator TaxID=111125 RepID=A0ABN9MDD1_9NEOB|nr:unnamed protein product [Ranitomeya imitator]
MRTVKIGHIYVWGTWTHGPWKHTDMCRPINLNGSMCVSVSGTCENSPQTFDNYLEGDNEWDNSSQHTHCCGFLADPKMRSHPALLSLSYAQ